jgi:predicted MFS family arabinose efflux permease
VASAGFLGGVGADLVYDRRVTTSPTSPADEERGERNIAYLLAGVQFVNVLDFMMVNPLGPLLAESLSVPTSQLPTIAGSYTAAASVTGLLGALFLERFERKRALVVCLVGLAFGTLLGGLATGFRGLVLARIVAGLFGGPATSLTFAIVADTIPPERRGRAFGIVMGGFAVASVLGVPAGLALAQLGGWRAPFFGVSAVIVIAIGFALRLLPTIRAHVDTGRVSEGPIQALRALVARPVALAALSLTGLTMTSSFVVIPSLPSHVQYNLALPREQLGWLYLAGGVASFATTRLVGPIVDRVGALRVSVLSSIAISAVVTVLFVVPVGLPVLAMTTAFFVAMGARGVAYNAITSMVPRPHERASFQSVQSAVQHAASSAAAFLSAQLLAEDANHRLLHVERIGLVSIALTLAVPVVMGFVVRHVASMQRAHEQSALEQGALAPSVRPEKSPAPEVDVA